MIKLKINGKAISAKEGQSILDVARENGFKIPTLCHHPDLEVKANCRICVVEVKGEAKLFTACSTLAQDGLDIRTNSPAVKKARDLNLELVFAEHAEKCAACVSQYDCHLLDLAREYNIKIGRFRDRKGKRRTYKFGNAVEIDGSQCIDCGNCLEACALQKINYLEMSGYGADQEIKPVADKKKACIYCGQCALHCPVAAAQEQTQYQAVAKALADKRQLVVAQFAPAVRVSLGEAFGLRPGSDCTGKTYSALRRLGFKHVFDINFGADITTMTEAEELVERLKGKKQTLPMMTSCCPAWVAYAEFYHPELIPHLTSARSPHIHSAGAIKAYWAKQKGIDSKRITVVSVVPCTAKKYEAARPELKFKGRPLVDYVLTTRELAYMIQKRGLDFKNLPEGKGEPLFNDGSGAAAIYGASGGVMESALRSAASFLAGNEGGKELPPLEFKAVRGLAGFKSATVTLGGKRLRVGVVNGIGNIGKVLPKLKSYHYVEVMACPGGCLGGGGQPIPTTRALRQARLEGMYRIDSGKPVRRAHENKAMKKYYDWAKEKGLEKQLLHTTFKPSQGSPLSSIRPGSKSWLSF